MKDNRNNNETETENYKDKKSNYKTYMNIEAINEIALPTIATTSTTTSVAITGRVIPCSILTPFAVGIE